MTDIATVTNEFHSIYLGTKKADESLKTKQKELFEVFNQQLESQLHSQKVINIPLDSDIKSFINEHHPGWRLVTVTKLKPMDTEQCVMIEEDPAFLKYSYTHPETNIVFGRDRVEGTPSLDDERLRSEDPALWERITEWPQQWYFLVESSLRALHQSGLPWSDDVVHSWVDRHLRRLNVQRTLIDIAKLGPTDLALLEQYIIPGKVSVRLRPPKLAKSEDS